MGILPNAKQVFKAIKTLQSPSILIEIGNSGANYGKKTAGCIKAFAHQGAFTFPIFLISQIS
jgi:hypothetical protein